MKTDKEIMKEEVQFYTQLYKSKSCNNEELMTYFNNIEFPKKLNDKDNSFLKGKITFEECFAVVKQMKLNISPGADGLTTDFYHKFWPYVGKYVVNAINKSYEKGIMPPSFRKIISSLLYKKNERDLLKKLSSNFTF